MLARPYFEEQRLTYWTDCGGVQVALHFKYRPLSAYCAALEQAGLLIESLRKPAPPNEALSLLKDGEWRQLVPSFLHMRAIKR